MDLQKDNIHLNNLLEDALDDLLDGENSSEIERSTSDKGDEDSSEKLNNVTGGLGQLSIENIIPKVGTSKNLIENESARSGEHGEVDEEKVDKFFKDMQEELNGFLENMKAQVDSEGLPRISPDEARVRIDESVPQIFDLMQNLLSKELLYPALKDLSPKLNEWIEKNSSKLGKNERKQYKKQKDIINEMILVFDNDSLDDQERFDKNSELMEKMQSLGPLPKELTVAEGQGACSIM